MQPTPSISNRARKVYTMSNTVAETDEKERIVPIPHRLFHSIATGEIGFQEKGFVAPRCNASKLTNLLREKCASGGCSRRGVVSPATPIVLSTEERSLTYTTPPRKQKHQSQREDESEGIREAERRPLCKQDDAVADGVLNLSLEIACVDLAETPAQPTRRASSPPLAESESWDSVAEKDEDQRDDSDADAAMLSAAGDTCAHRPPASPGLLLIGPHDPCVSTTECKENPDSKGNSDSSSDGAAKHDFAPQPPHHRRLDYTGDATVLFPSPKPEWSRSRGTTAPGQPFTPERQANTARYCRGVIISGTAEAAPTVPGTEELSALGAGGVSLLVGTAVEVAGRANTPTKERFKAASDVSSRLPATAGATVQTAMASAATPESAVAHFMQESPLYRSVNDHTGLSRPHGAMDKLSPVHSLAVWARDCAAASLPLDNSLRGSSTGSTDSATGSDEDDDSLTDTIYRVRNRPREPSPGAVTPRFSAKEEVLPVVRRSGSTNSSSCHTAGLRVTGSVTAAADVAMLAVDVNNDTVHGRDDEQCLAHALHPHDATLPLDSSDEKRGPSSNGGCARGPSYSSYGCTDQDTPVGGSSNNPLHSDDAGGRTGSADHTTVLASASPTPGPRVPLPVADRTVEGKRLSSTEEMCFVVRTRISAGGVRLSFNDDDKADEEHEGAHNVASIAGLANVSVRGLSGPVQASRCVRGALPASLADTLINEAAATHDELLAEQARSLVTAWAALVVESEWMRGNYICIVAPPTKTQVGTMVKAAGPVDPVAPLRSGRARLSDSLTGRSVSLSLSLLTAPPLPPPTQSDGSRSPQMAFARSPEALSSLSRITAFSSPTLMSPHAASHAAAAASDSPTSAMAEAGLAASFINTDAASPPLKAAVTSEAFVPVTCALESPHSQDTLFEEAPPSPSRMDSAHKKPSEFVLANTDPTTTPGQLLLKSLFASFCESGGDTNRLSGLLDAYTESCLECHTHLFMHALFNTAYISFIGLERLMALEWMARREICMARDLFIRDKIELFVLLSPMRPPSLRDALVTHVKQSLTNFRKALHLRTDPKQREIAEKGPRRAQSAAAPPRSQQKARQPPGRGEALNKGGHREAGWGTRPPLPSRSASRSSFNAVDKKGTRPLMVHNCSDLRSVPRAPPPSLPATAPRRASYGHAASPPLQLPSIELISRRGPLLRGRERVAPVSHPPPVTRPPDQCTDEAFMDLAYCRDVL